MKYLFSLDISIRLVALRSLPGILWQQNTAAKTTKKGKNQKDSFGKGVFDAAVTQGGDE